MTYPIEDSIIPAGKRACIEAEIRDIIPRLRNIEERGLRSK